MRLLAGICIGVACALLAGVLTGQPIRFRARLSSRRRGPTRAHVRLQQAGVGLTPVQFGLGSLGAGLAAFSILAVLCGSPFVAAVPAVAVGLTPRAYFGRRRARRMRLVQAAWPDGLRDLLASISAGRSLGQAVEALALTGPEPLREAFAEYPALARMLGTVPALEIVREEVADPTSDRVLEVLILAHVRGGAIVRPILEDLARATTRDLRLLEEVETEGLEMRINARAVVVLPWLVLVALTATEGPFRDFYRRGAGIAVLLVAGALSALGVLILGRVGREPDEPRVFGRGAPG